MCVPKSLIVKLSPSPHTQENLSVVTIRCNSTIVANDNAFSFDCQPEDFGYPLSKNYSQTSMVDNQNDLFMHFLSMRHNGQVATNDCNGHVLF